MEVMNNQYRCEFVSYKISEDILAEIFAANGIMGANFESGYGVRVTRTDDGIIFSRDGECGLPKLIFTAWGGDVCELSPEAADALDRLVCEPSAEDRTDCRQYRCAFAGSSADKMAFLSGLFGKTDIGARLDITEIRASKCGMTTGFGAFGLEKKCYVGGRLSGWQLNIVGESSEENAVLLLKDGALTVRDRGDAFRWDESTLVSAVKYADKVDAPNGLTAIKEISCADIGTFAVPNSVLTIAGGAFAGCGRLQKVCVGKPNVLLGNGFVNGGVVLAGVAGGSAEKYAAENGLGFELMNVTEPAPFAFEIADGVWLAAAETSVYRKQNGERAELSDVFYMPDCRADDFDCEIQLFSEEAARQSGVAAQLEGFGELLDSETVRNDRNGYIKVSARRASNGAYSVSLEIEHESAVIIIHTEQMGAGEKSEKALYRRYCEMGDSIVFGVRPAAETLKKPDYDMGESAEEVTEPVVEAVPEAEVTEPVAEAVPEAEVTEPVAEAVPEVEVTEPVAEVQSIKLVRGARFDLSGYNDKMLVIDMDYQAEQGIDIDGYIFLLAANGKVRSDADLVFFGQKASVDRAVNNHPSKTRCFTVELSKLDADVSKLAVAFAIYGDNAEQIFSCVSKPVVRISCNGQEICSYEVEGLKEEKSVVAIEMYNKNGWKLRTVGLGYKEALKTLCGSYGVEVNSQ